jgi:hypothetical protein
MCGRAPTDVPLERPAAAVWISFQFQSAAEFSTFRPAGKLSPVISTGFEAALNFFRRRGQND